MFRKSTLKTYGKKKTDSASTTSSTSSILREDIPAEKELQPKELLAFQDGDKTLEYVPFNTKFDHLARNTKMPPEPPNLPDDSSYSSSDVNDNLDDRDSRRNYKKQKVNKVAKVQAKNLGSKVYRDNVSSDENAEPMFEPRKSRKRGRKKEDSNESKDPVLRKKRRIAENPMASVYRGRKDKNPCRSKRFMRCSVNLTRVMVPLDKSMKALNLVRDISNRKQISDVSAIPSTSRAETRNEYAEDRSLNSREEKNAEAIKNPIILLTRVNVLQPRVASKICLNSTPNDRGTARPKSFLRFSPIGQMEIAEPHEDDNDNSLPDKPSFQSKDFTLKETKMSKSSNLNEQKENNSMKSRPLSYSPDPKPSGLMFNDSDISIPFTDSYAFPIKIGKENATKASASSPFLKGFSRGSPEASFENSGLVSRAVSASIGNSSEAIGASMSSPYNKFIEHSTDSDSLRLILDGSDNTGNTSKEFTSFLDKTPGSRASISQASKCTSEADSPDEYAEDRNFNPREEKKAEAMKNPVVLLIRVNSTPNDKGTVRPKSFLSFSPIGQMEIAEPHEDGKDDGLPDKSSFQSKDLTLKKSEISKSSNLNQQEENNSMKSRPLSYSPNPKPSGLMFNEIDIAVPFADSYASPVKIEEKNATKASTSSPFLEGFSRGSLEASFENSGLVSRAVSASIRNSSEAIEATMSSPYNKFIEHSTDSDSLRLILDGSDNTGNTSKEFTSFLDKTPGSRASISQASNCTSEADFPDEYAEDRNFNPREEKNAEAMKNPIVLLTRVNVLQPRVASKICLNSSPNDRGTARPKSFLSFSPIGQMEIAEPHEDGKDDGLPDKSSFQSKDLTLKKSEISNSSKLNEQEENNSMKSTPLSYSPDPKSSLLMFNDIDISVPFADSCASPVKIKKENATKASTSRPFLKGFSKGSPEASFENSGLVSRAVSASIGNCSKAIGASTSSPYKKFIEHSTDSEILRLFSDTSDNTEATSKKFTSSLDKTGPGTPVSMSQASAVSCDVSDNIVFLKPGKAWFRSLSLFRQVQSQQDLEVLAVGKGKKWRRNVSTILDMQRQGCSQPDPSRVSSQTYVGSPGSRFVGRTAIRVVPDGKKSEPYEDSPFLEAYGITSSENRETLGKRTTSTVPRKTVVRNEQFADDSFESIPKSIKSVTSRDVVLTHCSQDSSLPFEECYPDSYLKQCRKIGEGVYGEVFLHEKDEVRTVIKIIPIEGDMKVNGEQQKKFDEILTEIVIANELRKLRYSDFCKTSSFVEVKNIRCVDGKYPQMLIDLWQKWDNEENSENDCPDMFNENQLYIVLELEHGGQDLGAFVFQNSSETHALFVQLALALAVAEEFLEFEHRDLHWGNILVSRTEDTQIDYKLRGKDISVASKGVKVTIIDFTVSRMSHQGCNIFYDLSLNEVLFAVQSDYQFEIYRLMRQKVQNNWQTFEPFTNILWLHYALDKMITAVRYRRKRPTLKTHKNGLDKLIELKNEILDYSSAYDFVTNCDRVTRLQASRSSAS